MRIVVLSDSHRRINTLIDIIELHRDDADIFLFLGDIDDDFDDALCVYPKIKYYRVCGNNEWHSEHPYNQVITVENKKILFTHGHTYNVKYTYDNIINEAKSINADICLFGHTHNQFTDYIDGLYVMNPGAVCSNEYAMVDITDAGIVLIPASI